MLKHGIKHLVEWDKENNKFIIGVNTFYPEERRHTDILKILLASFEYGNDIKNILFKNFYFTPEEQEFLNNSYISGLKPTFSKKVNEVSLPRRYTLEINYEPKEETFNMNEQTPEQPIKQGDVVRLKSGGPDMTILEIKDMKSACAWFNGLTKMEGVFPIASLDKVALADKSIISKEQVSNIIEEIEEEMNDTVFSIIDCLKGYPVPEAIDILALTQNIIMQETEV